MAKNIERFSMRENQSGEMININPHQVRFLQAEGDNTVIVFSETHRVVVNVPLHQVSLFFGRIFGREVDDGTEE